MSHSNQGLLQAGFRGDWQRALIVSFPDDPEDVDGWPSHSVGALMRRGAWPLNVRWNNYFCVSLFKGEHRREVDFESLCVLAVDDVGKKVDAGRLLDRIGTPSWAVETSPGNQQWFWWLWPWVRDLAKARALTRLVQGNDARSVTRVMRLPEGRNRKVSLGLGPEGFPVRNAGGQVAGSVDPDEVMGAHGVTSWDVGGSGVRSTTPGASAEALIGDDLVGGWLLRMGRVKGLTSNRLGVEIVCPWEGLHTIRTSTGTAYFPKSGGFECHHGHCAGRDGVTLRAWLEAEVERSGLWDGGIAGSRFGTASDDDDGSEGDAPENAARMVLDRYVYVKSEHRYFDLVAGAVVMIDAFNFSERRRLRPWLAFEDAKTKTTRLMTPHAWFEAVKGRIADAQTYWPGRGAWFQEDGIWLINRWRPGPRPARGTRVTDAMVRPWVELVEDFCRNEGPGVAELVLDFFALVVGAPGVKPGWHLVLHSEVHGIGKDMMLVAVRQAVGENNVASPAAGVLGAGFNGYAEKRLVVVTDLERNTRGAMTTHDVYETIKPFTEHTSRMIEINRKFMQPYQVPNLSAWVITSNAEDALPLADTDRRFFVVSSTMARRAGAYYSDLRKWLDAHWAEIAEWLIQRWETLPQGRRDVLLDRAPGTPGKAAMTLAAEDRLTAWTREQIEDDVWPDLMSSRDLQDAFERAGRRVLGVVPTAHKWGRVLVHLGAKKTNKGEKVQLDDGLIRVWVIRNSEKFDRMNAAELARAYVASRELR